MQSRQYTFIAGINQSAQPDPGTPTLNPDLITLEFFNDNAMRKQKITGAWDNPYLAVAATPIAHGMTQEEFCVMYIKGTAGAVNMSANPQIAAGTIEGQVLKLIFTHATDTVLLQDSDGLAMPNGDIRSLEGTILEFVWDEVSQLWRNSFWNNVGTLV